MSQRRGLAVVATALLLATLVLPACAASSDTVTPTTETSTSQEASTMGSISIDINGKTFSATLSDTEAARQFAARLPMTLDMSELNGNEKYYETGAAYSTAGSSVVSPIEAGDLMLYGDDCVVLFYSTHDNSQWSYVPLAKVDDPAGIAEAVGSGSVTVTFSAAN